MKSHWPNPNQDPDAKPHWETSSVLQAQNQDLKDMDVLCTFKIKIVKIRIMDVPKTSDYINIKIQMPNPSQVHLASSKGPNEDLKDMEVFCNFKIKIESQIRIMVVAKNRDHIQIKIQMPNPSQEPSASSKAPNEDLKGHGCSLHLLNQDREQKFKSWCIKHQWPYPNQDPDAKPQSWTSSMLQSPKSGLRGHGFSVPL